MEGQEGQKDNLSINQTLATRAETKEIAEVLRYRKLVDYQNIWRSQPAIFFKESHTSMSDKDEIISNLTSFQKQGLTHVAMEMLSEEQQPVIDGYFAGTINRGEVLKIFKAGWDKKPGIAEKYMEMVEAIKTAGLKLLAIDLYSSESGYFSADFTRKRNANWARVIKNAVVQTPNARVLVYGGGAHMGYNVIHDSANEILSTQGVQSVVVGFTGGEEKVTDTWFLQDRVALIANQQGIASEKFQLRLNPQEVTRPADYLVHLPQTLKS